MQAIFIPFFHVSAKSAGTDKPRIVEGYLVASPDESDKLRLVCMYPRAGGSWPVVVTHTGPEQASTVENNLRSTRKNWNTSKYAVNPLKRGGWSVPKAARQAAIDRLPPGARMATPKEVAAYHARRADRDARMSRLAARRNEAPPALPSERKLWVSDGTSKSEVSFSEAVARAGENPEMLVWERGMVAWTPARDVADLQAALAVSAPPALPTGNPVMDAALASAAHADADAAAANS